MAFNRYRGDENVEAITKGAVTSQDDMTPLDMEEEEGARAQTLRERIYVFFSLEDNLFLKENPNIFFYAALYQVLNVCVIITSIVLMIVDSAPQYYGRNLTQYLALTIIEAITIAFFLFDYVIRLVTAPRTIRFVIDPLNIIDVLVIIPYFIQLGLEIGLGIVANTLAVLNVLKLFRLIRVFRFVRFGMWSGILVALLLGIRKALDAILLMVFLFLISMVFCSTLIFFSEQTISTFDAGNQTWIYTSGIAEGQPTPFQSIYDSFWWALITLTFVGEGTVAPLSPLGQAVGALSLLFGLLAWVFPIAIMVRSIIMEVNRYKKVRAAQRLANMTPDDLLLEVLRMSREIDANINDLKHTQKTVGILLFKLGQSFRGGAGRKESDGAGLPARFSSGLNFSAAEQSEDTSE